MKTKTWHGSIINKGTGSEQGLIIDQDGKTIAFALDPEDTATIAASPALFEAAIKAEQMLTEANAAFYGKGSRKALDKALEDSKSLLAELRSAIASAKGL